MDVEAWEEIAVMTYGGGPTTRTCQTKASCRRNTHSVEKQPEDASNVAGAAAIPVWGSTATADSVVGSSVTVTRFLGTDP